MISCSDEWNRWVGKGRTRGATDIVEGEVGDTRVQLHEEGERLANATGGTENGDLGEL